MKTIPLTQGYTTTVDDEDYESLMVYKWHARKDRDTWYAVSGQHVLMHRLILNPLDGQQVDHKDRNGLNNVRANLRLASHADNIRNRRVQRNNTTGFKGVRVERNCRSRWSARVGFNGKVIYLGMFASPILAARAYDAKAIELFGEFANPNFPITRLS